MLILVTHFESHRTIAQDRLTDTWNATLDPSRLEAVDRIRADLEFLASDDQEGRGVGTDGLVRAANFIADRWKSLGLVTEWFDGSPLQPFSIPGSMIVGPAENNRLVAKPASEEPISLELEVDFRPLAVGGNGSFEGSMVFAGYGITAESEDKSFRYDDYDGLHVAGKVVIILRKEPRQNDPECPLDGTDPSVHSYFSTKVTNAVNHQAAAVILVNDEKTTEAESADLLLPVDSAGRAVGRNTIPVFFVKRAVMDAILNKSIMKTLSDLEKEIDSDLQPRSIELEGWTMAGESLVQPSKIPLYNVIGVVPGSGNLANEFVVVGAHYDHVGMGGPGSLAPGTIEVHNGADDNASGTACLMEMASRLTAVVSENRRTIVFIAFSGEERGLLGSRHYVRNPRFPMEATVAMVNFDMVGRLRGRLLTVFGTKTAKEFETWIDNANATHGFLLEKQPFGAGPSDHQSFFEFGVPVYHFFTGLHNDYHRPSDDIDKINVEGIERIASLGTDLVAKLATHPNRPTFEKVRGRAIPANPPSARLGVEVRLVGSDPPKLAISKVVEDSAGAKANLQVDDMILQVDSLSLLTVRSFAEYIAKHFPGDRLKLLISRQGQQMEIDVILGF